MLDRLWRGFCTISAYLLFGAVAVLAELLLPLWMRRYPKGEIRQLANRRMISRLWSLFLAYLERSGVIRYRFSHQERLGKPGQLILANHPSLLDVLLLLSAVPGSNCVVKQSLWHNPLLRRTVRGAGFIANNANEQTFAEGVAALQRGEVLIIFPEGTRTGYDGEISFNRAAVTIGMHGASEIVPVVIRMHPLGLKKGDPFYRIPEKAYDYRIHVGEAIVPAERLAEKPLPVAAKKLTQELITYFKQEV